MSEVIGTFLRTEFGGEGTDPARDAEWFARLLFVDARASARKYFGVNAVRYSFIVMDLHHLLLAGLPAHSAPESDGSLHCRRLKCIVSGASCRRSEAKAALDLGQMYKG